MSHAVPAPSKFARSPFGPSLLWLVLLAGLVGLLGCRAGDEYPNRPVTLICPWAVGGGTDRICRQLAVHLQQELGVPVNVVNATGGQGVIGHRRGLRALPNGYTITMITPELNTFQPSNLALFTWRDYRPLASLNQDAAALFCRQDAPWRDLNELEADARRRTSSLRASGTAQAGAWHLALAGWEKLIGLPDGAIVWSPSAGSAPALQELRNGGIDLVCCSLPEARTLLGAGDLRCLGVMAAERVPGFDEIPTFREQGMDYVWTGWRGLAVPKLTPEPIVARLEAALDNVLSGHTQLEGKSLPQFLQQQGFDHQVRRGEDFLALLAEDERRQAELLASPEFNAGGQPDGLMRFPFTVLFLLGCVSGALVVRHLRQPRGEALEASEDLGPRNWWNFAWVALAIPLYMWTAPAVGFIPAAGVVLFALLKRFGTRWAAAAVISLAFAPAAYYIFAHGMGVPLPRVWLEW